METFGKPRQLVVDPNFDCERQIVSAQLAHAKIDAPIRNIIASFADLHYCFTLQSCYGHFIHSEQPHPKNLSPLPAHDVGAVKYRIAYIALCIKNSSSGRRLIAALGEVPAIAPGLVQLGSPGWFWQRHLNSYALQVEPARFRCHDEAIIDYREALQVQQARDLFFVKLASLVEDLTRQKK